MNRSLDEVDQLIQFSTKTNGSRSDFTENLRPIAFKGLTLKQMQSATRHLKTFHEPLIPLKIAIMGSYTLELLREYWIFHGLINGFEVELYIAPFGQVLQELQEDSKLIEFQPDITYLLMQWTDFAGSFGEPFYAFEIESRERIEKGFTSNLEELISATQQFCIGTIVLNLLPFPNLPTLGLYDVMSMSSETSFHHRLKESISEMIGERFPSVYFDDGDVLIKNLGYDGLFDSRLWYTSQYPYSSNGGNLLVQHLFRYPVLLKTPKVKCIVLDCDNTLWGGITGENGLHGIDIGPEYPGSCFMAFQRRLLDFQNRGILLAICSKNNPDDVQEVLQDNPHMILKDEHFAAIRVNWDPKPDNLKKISDELNLGLDSFLFVDDSPQECRMMRKLLPEVRTVQVPEKPIDIPTMLDHLQELEILSYTEEDRERSKMYVQNRRRQEIIVSSSDISEYLKSLQMNMKISINGSDHIPRIAQLTQKTNQFNLTTKRYSEKDIQSFLISPDWLVAYFSLSDIFGDSGIVGLALVTNMQEVMVNIDTFLLSCRVIGRKAEDEFLHQLLKILREEGKGAVNSSYISTPKNGLVKDFWDQQGFTKINDGSYEFHLENLSDSHPADEFIEVHLSQEIH